MKYTKVKKVDTSKIEYYEKQSFKINWLRVMILLATFFVTFSFGYGIFQMLSGSENVSFYTLLFSTLMIVLMFIINFMIFKGFLETAITVKGIYFRMFPFALKYRFIPIENITSFFARRYSPMGEYGGWGIRYGFSSGWAWNAYGNEGLQLIFNDETKLLLGSQKAEEMEQALVKILVKNNLK